MAKYNLKTPNLLTQLRGAWLQRTLTVDPLLVLRWGPGISHTGFQPKLSRCPRNE